MTTLPPATDFTGASVTEGQFKTAMTSLRDYLSQLLGDDSILREGDDLLINGAMAVAQEGTSFTGVGAAATKYVLDQWLVYTIGSPQGRATVTRESGVFAGFGFSAKIDTTTAEAAVAAGEVWAFQQRIEAQNLQHLKYGSASALSLVCTFNIKSPKSGTHCIALHQPDGTRSIVKEFTVASADTEEEITVVFTGDASGTINNDTGEGLRLTWPLVAGSTFQVAADAWAAGEDYATSNQQNILDNTANNFEITGVRLRTGTVATATPFVHRSIGAELELSKRYYEELGGTASEHFGNGQCLTTTIARCVVRWSEKRVAPTVTVSAAGDFNIFQVGGAGEAVTVFTFSSPSPKSAGAVITVAANIVAGDATVLLDDGGANARIKIDARL